MEHKYEIGRFLGKGSFASVYLARNTAKRRYAIKLVDVTACQRRAQTDDLGECPTSVMELLRREIDIHSSLSSSCHPNVVQFIESFAYIANKNHLRMEREMIALVMEYCCRGDLQCYFKQVRDECSTNELLLAKGTFLSNHEIWHGISQVLSGVAFLHSRGIIHRDIKASNVFLSPLKELNSEEKDTDLRFRLTDCCLKLGDFGLAAQMNDDDDWCEARNTICGTPSCLAPEVVRSARGTARNDTEQTVDNERMSTYFNFPCFRGADLNDTLFGIHDDIDTLLIQKENNREISQALTGGYGQPADLWSTGCLLYTMIAGRNPFSYPCTAAPKSAPKHNSDLRIQQTIDRVINGDWVIPTDVYMTPELEGLLNQLLSSQPNKRGTARSLLAVHPYFRSSRNTTAIETSAIHIMNQLEPLHLNSSHNKENINNGKYDQVNHDNPVVVKASGHHSAVSRHVEDHETQHHSEPLTPMDNLQNLTSSKYEWNEGSSKFSAFLLGQNGLVIQKRITDSNGLWMHVTCDGRQVFCGALTQSNQICVPEMHNTLLDEAFKFAPRKFLYLKTCETEMCDKSTAFQRPPNSKKSLQLYKILERLVQSIKSSTPKITLYLYTFNPISNKESSWRDRFQHSYRMIGKVMLMENSPNADIEAAFVDGTTIRFKDMTLQKGRLIISWTDGNGCHEASFDSNLNAIIATDLTKILSSQYQGSPKIHAVLQEHSSHFKIVQSAFQECTKIEQCQNNVATKDLTHRCPISKNIVLSSWDSNEWVYLDDDARIQ